MQIGIEQRRGTPIMDQYLLNEAKEIHRYFSKFSDFPEGYCRSAARELERLGLRYVEGSFVTDNYYGRGIRDVWDHAWAEDGERTIIELTGAQFNSHLKHLMRNDVLLIRTDDPIRNKYREGLIRSALATLRLLWNPEIFFRRI